MTEAEVRARLVTFVPLTDEPALTAADVDVVMDMAKRVDKYGVWPTETGWSESYDVNFAIAYCWLIKAGRLANRYLFMSGGKMFSRNQFYEHCIELHKKFLAKSDLKSLRLAPEVTGRLETIPTNWNSHVVDYC